MSVKNMDTGSKCIKMCKSVRTENIPTGHLAVVLPINRSSAAGSKYGGKTDVKMF